MSTQQDRQMVQRVINTCFAEVKGDPMLAWRIMNYVKRSERCQLKSNILPFRTTKSHEKKQNYLMVNPIPLAVVTMETIIVDPVEDLCYSAHSHKF